MTCDFCHHFLSGYSMSPPQNATLKFHLYQDEFGNACPCGEGSCWEKSNHGTRSLAEYIKEVCDA